MLQLLQGSELYLISRVENDEEQAVPPFLPRPALEPAPAAPPDRVLRVTRNRAGRGWRKRCEKLARSGRRRLTPAKRWPSSARRRLG